MTTSPDTSSSTSGTSGTSNASGSSDASGSSGWRSLALQAGLGVESILESVRRQFQERFRPDLPLHIIPYTGFANADHLQLSGRVLVYRKPPDTDPDSTWDALRNAYRRFETDEVPGVRVTASCDADGPPVETLTDDEGYFYFDMPTPPAMPGGADATDARDAAAPAAAGGASHSSDRPAGHDRRITVQLNLPDNPGEFATTEAQVVIPAVDAHFGVISDIDDTVLVTKATSIIQMMKLTLLGSSRSRMAFPGVAAFYQALHADRNPFFYVSSSPWNLHEFLADFMRINRLITGPMLLRDFGLGPDKFIAGPHQEHKLDAARRVLDHYPDLPFILIGDSGQKDPEIYLQLIEAYTDRILAVYIRDVSGDNRDREVQALIERAAAHGVEMLLVPDSRAAAVHAVARGFMADSDLASVSRDVEEDQLPLPDADATA